MIKRALLIVVLAAFSGGAIAGSDAWLLGNWKIAYDPDGETNEVLTFSSGGEFVITDISTGQKLLGTYSVKPAEIDVSLVQRGEVFMQVRLTYEGSRDKLFYNPDNTDDPAYYMKLH